ncbi:MAG: hypothetical protein ABW168_05775 [Sedimenticola sp.]
MSEQDNFKYTNPVQIILSERAVIDAAGLVVVLEGPARFIVGGEMEMSFVLRNPLKVPRSFCDYHTPFEGIRNDIFEVIDGNGNRVEYEGIMARRIKPSASNFKTVPPRSYVRVLFDLSRGYSLRPGYYTVRFSGNGISGLPASDSITIEVTSDQPATPRKR